jgi:hypothetical protein
MKHLISLAALFIVCLLPITAQKADVVFGKVVFNSSNGKFPLTSAKVFLCSKTDTVMGFTDNDGNIAFYNIKVNNYILKTMLNSDTLSIKLQNNKSTREKPVKVTNGNNNFGTINVWKI